jgi:GT2 family glycosyltransferase
MISIVVISKDEPALAETLHAVCEQVAEMSQEAEVIVVDASDGRLDRIRDRFEGRVTWLSFARPSGVSVSIPHQRNAGVRAANGTIIVFTDAGCLPEPGWVQQIVAPLLDGEDMSFGLTLGSVDGMKLHDRMARNRVQQLYLTECSTINTAFRREVYDKIGGFDEGFAYGSDVDFSWRAVDQGYRIRSAPNAVVRHDWGTTRRQMRRSYLYGRARARLYRKHPRRLRRAWREDSMTIIYPLFLIGIPIGFIFPLYPALLLIPAWRNRADGPVRVVVDHLIFGFGVLVELVTR